MDSTAKDLDPLVSRGYAHGFVTEIETDVIPPGLSEDVIRQISSRKREPEWVLEYRLKAFRHWLTMDPPQWSSVHYPPIDYQAISYFAAPKKKPGHENPQQMTFNKVMAYNKKNLGLVVQALPLVLPIYFGMHKDADKAKHGKKNP